MYKVSINIDLMGRRNLKRYYQAWELKQQGKTCKEIGLVMGIGQSRAAELVRYINFKIEYKKPLSNELKKLIQKYAKI